MTNRTPQITVAVITLASVIALSSCGGGGSAGQPLTPPPAPGTLDSSFGIGGIVDLPERSPPPQAAINAIAIQPDGKIVAAGVAREFVSLGGYHAGSATIARYNTDGTLDPGFGVGGIVEISPSYTDLQTFFTGVALQPDGRIVAAGRTTNGYGCIVVRVNADGARDRTCGMAGSGLVSVDSRACNAIALQPDGKIVVAGFAPDDGYGTSWLMRFLSDGTPDTSFGSGAGEVGISIDSSTSSPISAIARQADGAILVAGTAITYRYPRPFSKAFALMRFDATGRLDRGFGAGGIVVANVGVDGVAEANGMALQPDGRIVMAGIAGKYQPDLQVVLAQFLPSGVLDPNFGHAGSVLTKFDAQDGGAYAIALQSNGKIVVGGFNFMVARYDGSGTLDQGFGTGGRVQPIGSKGAARAVAIQPDDRVVAAGGDFDLFVLARCFGDPGP